MTDLDTAPLMDERVLLAAMGLPPLADDDELDEERPDGSVRGAL